MTDRVGRPVGIVLAAGYGRRLRPLTDHYAKPVIPFLDRPLITYSLDCLRQAGVRRIGVNAFHHADQIARTVDSWRRACDDDSLAVRVCAETELLGTGGGARGVWEAMGRPPGRAVVVNGDAYRRSDLGPHIEEHCRSGAAATLLLTDRGEGGIVIDPDSRRILEIPGADQPATWSQVPAGQRRAMSFSGISILGPEAVQALPVTGCLLRGGLAPLLSGGAVLAGLEDAGIHLDVGTPDRYWRATAECLDRLKADQLRSGPETPEGVVLHPPLLLGSDVLIEGPCVLGPYLVLAGRTTVATGAVASSSVVYDGRLEGRLEGELRVGEVGLTLPLATRRFAIS